MKARKIELDVDFIGGQSSLTNAEEKALRDFFKKRKLTAKKPSENQKQKVTKRSRVNSKSTL